MNNIIIPVYFIESDDGEKIIDRESMRAEFEHKLEIAAQKLERPDNG